MLSLSFAKLVATPTDTAWSQVYNAGNLFAALSLSKEETEENASLNGIGKEIFSNLQAEFFTLEQKDLETIKEAIKKSTDTIPENVKTNFCVAFFKENVLYLYIYGQGKIVMKRDGKVGVLLEKVNDDKEILTASGFLENDDTIVLQTPQFAQDMLEETISSALDLLIPNDIAESLSPGMHEKDDGGQAAIVINYKDSKKPAHEEPENDFSEAQPNEDDLINSAAVVNESTIHIEKEETNITPEELTITDEEVDIVVTDNRPDHDLHKPSSPSRFSISTLIESIKLPFLKRKNAIHLNHRKKLFLTIAAIILGILILSVSFTKQRESDSKTAALFASVYEPALENYEDGLAVKSINNEFARDDFLKAKTQLQAGKDKFKKGSDEEKKITELLTKVEAELVGESTGERIKPKEVTLNANHILSVAKANNSGISFTRDQNGTYFVTEEAVVSVTGNSTKKDIIKNDNDWEKAVGISTYQSNMYLLDQENGVLKFTAGSAGYGKSSYLKSNPSNIGSASAIAIDGSVWVLFKDGAIMKFTRGVAEEFKLTGLDKPLRSPTRLFTNIDTEGLYVLDPANSRIVEFDKDGDFQTAYTADILKNAKEIEVSEKDGKILVLSGGKFYELPL